MKIACTSLMYSGPDHFKIFIPVILSGGAGTRLWPVSREAYPKPFIKFDDGQSLLLKTYQRVAGILRKNALFHEIVTVTNRDYYFISKEEFERAHLGSEVSATFLLEPVARNTAPAIALAARYVLEKFGQHAVMLVLAADHLIEDDVQFEEAVFLAAQMACEGKISTFGVVPDQPQTGFGYIQIGESLGDAYAVKRFVEKPDQLTAEEYVKSGQFLWNAGMFCFKPQVMLDEIAQYEPKLIDVVAQCWQKMKGSMFFQGHCDFLEMPYQEFSSAPNISIDYAVMERANNVIVVPSHFKWNDIGSWNAVAELYVADENDNRAVGEAIFIESQHNFVQSENRLVAAVGVENLMIIDTPDALLVMSVDRVQDVKKVVSILQKTQHDAYRFHRTVARPWGTYTVLEEGENFKIKRIEVKPGASLSLQMHHHRSEHWIVVKGMAKVVNGEKEFLVGANQSTYIPAGQKHRLENPGILNLVLIEVQSGEYLGEEDIIRFQDNYGRVEYVV